MVMAGKLGALIGIAVGIVWMAVIWKVSRERFVTVAMCASMGRYRVMVWWVNLADEGRLFDIVLRT